MINPHVLPELAVDHARSFLEVPGMPATPRSAATVILLRDGCQGVPGSLEVFMQRRHANMAFAASALVFPGGGVDRKDSDTKLDWSGPSPNDWAETLGVPDSEASAIICAGVRELFEEAGVLLAGSDGRLVADVSTESWEEARVALENREISIAQLLRDRSLSLHSELVASWRAWLTPEFEPRRYLAHFLIAAVPDGQIPRTASGEAEDSLWISIADVLEGAGTEHMLLPPQLYTCAELYHFDSVADVFKAARSTARECVVPRLVRREGGIMLDFPAELDRVLAAVQSSSG